MMLGLGVLICFLVSFVFSGIEAGILSVNRVRLRHRLKLRDPAAIKLNSLLKHPERLLVTVLVVTNLMNILAISLVTQELAGRLGANGYLVALALFLPFYLLVLELLPKSLFRRFPYRALAALADPLRLANKLLTPLHFVGRGVSRVIAGSRPVEQQKLFVAREEFKYLTIESERTGTLGQAERQMIHSVVDFRAVTAMDVMIPMSDVHWIEAEAAIAKLVEVGGAKSIDRWPVISKDGELTGLVTLFDIALSGSDGGRIENFQRRIVRVGPEEPAYAVLRKLRAARSTMAAVIGPEDKPIGVVTWEALISRLVSIAAA